MIRRLRRVIAAALIPFVVFWSIMIPRQAYAFAPVGAAPIVIVGTMASGAIVPIVIGAAIAGIAYWAFQDLVSGDEVRVPAREGSAGAVPAPTGAPETAVLLVRTEYQGSGANSWFPSLEGACGDYAAYQDASWVQGTVTVTSSSGGVCYLNFHNTGTGVDTPDTYNPSTRAVSSCPAGYTSSGGVCSLTNPWAAVVDTKQDYSRSGGVMSGIAGDQVGSLSGTTMTTNSAGDTVLVAGKDSVGNAMQGKIIAMADGGSMVELKTQKQSGTGQTYVETQTYQTSPTGDVTSATQTATASQLKYDPGTKQYTEVAAPTGTVAPDLSPTSQGTTFPSDYARQGEAGTAAQVITGTLGPKLDKLVETSAAPADLIVPEPSGYTDFGNTFTGLLGWQLPGHSSQCPTASFTSPWNTSYTVDSHCQLISTHWTALQNAMAVVWTIAALFVVLRA